MDVSIEVNEKLVIARGVMKNKINVDAYIGDMGGLIYDDSTKDNVVGVYMQFYGRDAEKVADYMAQRKNQKQLKVKITIEEVK